MGGYKKRRYMRNESQDYTWLYTLSTLFMVMMAFFLVFYAVFDKGDSYSDNLQSSNVDTPQEPSRSDNSPLATLYWEFKQYISESGLEDVAYLSYGNTTITLAFHSGIFFNANSDDIRDVSNDTLDFIGNKIGDIEEYLQICAVGIHADSSDNTDERTVWDITSNRAAAVGNYFNSKDFINDSKKLIVQAFADNYPVPDGSTFDGRNDNQRVEFKIIYLENSLAVHEDIINDGLSAPVVSIIGDRYSYRQQENS